LLRGEEIDRAVNELIDKLPKGWREACLTVNDVGRSWGYAAPVLIALAFCDWRRLYDSGKTMWSLPANREEEEIRQHCEELLRRIPRALGRPRRQELDAETIRAAKSRYRELLELSKTEGLRGSRDVTFRDGLVRQVAKELCYPWKALKAQMFRADPTKTVPPRS